MLIQNCKASLSSAQFVLESELLSSCKEETSARGFNLYVLIYHASTACAAQRIRKDFSYSTLGDIKD